MLSLYCYNKPTLATILTDKYKYVNLTVPNVRFRNDRINASNIGSALLPLVLNEIRLEKHTTIIDEVNDNIKNSLNAILEDTNDKDLRVVRIYTEQVDELYNIIDPDTFTAPPNGVDELYNKCMEQVTAREMLTAFNAVTKIKVSKSKHMIIIITNYWDYTQLSDTYLTIGLIPVLFKDYAERFSEDELTYFKGLVKRSQVKRINNREISIIFEVMIDSKKYNEKDSDLLYQATIESLVATKINNMQQTIHNCEVNAASALEQYTKYKAEYYRSQKMLDSLLHNKEEEIDQLKIALKMEGIKKIERSGSKLGILFEAPLIFYDEEEAEIVLRNKDQNNIAVKLLTDIFIKHKYKMYVGAMAYFDFEDPRAFRDPGELNQRYQMDYNMLYNPHIQYFSCLGNYKPELRDAHTKQDIVMFNSIMLASLKSINFGDGTVINRWITTITSTWMDRDESYMYRNTLDIKCLEDTDGNRLSINDWVKKERIDNNEETTN